MDLILKPKITTELLSSCNAIIMKKEGYWISSYFMNNKTAVNRLTGVLSRGDTRQFCGTWIIATWNFFWPAGSKRGGPMGHPPSSAHNFGLRGPKKIPRSFERVFYPVLSFSDTPPNYVFPTLSYRDSTGNEKPTYKRKRETPVVINGTSDYTNLAPNNPDDPDPISTQTFS